MNRAPLFLLALTAALAVPGVAHANTITVDADCAGLTFSLPRGEAGTVVEATVEGRRVAIGTVANQFDPIAFTVPTPDPTVAHTWTVTVDSRWNTDQTWSETVPACVTPTTTSSTTTTTTAPTFTTTTTAPVTSSTTVVTTPRTTTTVPAGTTTTTVPFRLPDTGPTSNTWAQVAIAVTLGTLGVVLLWLTGGKR